jgi:hypothetical protein
VFAAIDMLHVLGPAEPLAVEAAAAARAITARVKSPPLADLLDAAMAKAPRHPPEAPRRASVRATAIPAAEDRAGS